MPKLVNVKLDLKLPGIGGVAGTWEPHESEVGAAWELYVEMVTRTPLGGFSSQDVKDVFAGRQHPSGPPCHRH